MNHSTALRQGCEKTLPHYGRGAKFVGIRNHVRLYQFTQKCSQSVILNIVHMKIHYFDEAASPREKYAHKVRRELLWITKLEAP